MLPIIRRFASPIGIEVEKIDISLAARILCQFPERLTPAQRVPDNLAELGEIVKGPDANVIKLPNISASVPQLVAAITELKGKGFNLPDFSQDPKTAEEKDVAARYASYGWYVQTVTDGDYDVEAIHKVREAHLPRRISFSSSLCDRTRCFNLFYTSEEWEGSPSTSVRTNNSHCST